MCDVAVHAHATRDGNPSHRYPGGRELVVIANDITFANGTFGPLEDEVFEKASQFARAKVLPF